MFSSEIVILPEYCCWHDFLNAAKAQIDIKSPDEINTVQYILAGSQTVFR